MRTRGAPLGALTLILFATALPLGAQSLKETIDLALAHDASIASAERGLEAARLEATAAARAALPTLSLGGSYQYDTSVPTATISIGAKSQSLSLGQNNNVDLNAGVKWTPFTGFAQEAGVELARLQALLADNSVDSAHTEVALSTITAFRQVQAAMLQIETLTSAAGRAQLQLDQTQSLERQGMATKVDVLSLSIARLDYDQKLIEAKVGLADAHERLKSLTGKEIEVPAPPEEEMKVELPPLRAEGLSQIKALAIQGDILETNRTLARSKLYPTVALTGAFHYGMPGLDQTEEQWMAYGTAGVLVTWAYDWGGDSLKVQAAERDLERLASDSTSAREGIELDYDSAVRDYGAAGEALKVLRASLDLARDKMGIVKSQYEQGLASTTDFNDANLQLTRAELDYRTQLLSMMLKASQIDALSGKSLDQWSVAQ
jgi:outer membrane protein TolC